ncbi:MAG TPA: NlpC/P60 family protein [Bryobacteraceae bacterium]|mgnify:CR=1 FL=1|nr:NlpC/P60 family protein [Bryobacteraceae bacterium]HPT27510.1 NlpC/P60 family protein [Bryobacteraceae bacterium]
MAAVSAQPPEDAVGRIRASIDRNLRRPYVWGSSGLKSFDCSGFVFRVFEQSGLYMKRTTARKYYFAMTPASKQEESKFATIVFFDNLKHMGIVNDGKSFYHAQSSIGTNLSEYSPYWRRLVCGYRTMLH